MTTTPEPRFGQFTLFWRVLFFVAAGVVLILSLIKLPADPGLGGDKAQHLIAYCGLTLLGLMAWPGLRPGWRLAAAVVAFSFLIEILQSLLPWRAYELMDLVANACGVAIALIAMAIYDHLRIKWAA